MHSTVRKKQIRYMLICMYMHIEREYDEKNSYFQQMSIGKAGQVKGCILHRLSDVTSQKVFLRRPMLHTTTLWYMCYTALSIIGYKDQR